MKDKIDELAGLMEEFKLSEAELTSNGFSIGFKKRSKPVAVQTVAVAGEAVVEEAFEEEAEAAPVSNKPAGTPITSPMTGIFYSAPSPGSPPFVKEGDEVIAGQVIGLIEAMKVFNEVPSPTSGAVSKLAAESGQLVNLGDPLLYIGS